MSDTPTDRLVKKQLSIALSESLTEKKRRADRATVAELTSNAIDGSEVRRTGFHDLCQGATHDLRQREFWRAKHELARDPGIAFSTGAEMEFRQNFPNLPDEELTVMIEEVRRNRPLGR
jgi:hypothetical protein